MTTDAVIRKDLSPWMICADTASKGADIGGHIGDFLVRQDIGKGRHLGITGVIVDVGPDAMRDRQIDRFDIAAPEPVVIQQVGIAFRTRRPGAVALGTIGAEHGPRRH